MWGDYHIDSMVEEHNYPGSVFKSFFRDLYILISYVICISIRGLK